MDKSEERRHKRHREGMPCTIAILDDRDRLISGFIVDFSASGLGLLTTEAIDVGTLLFVDNGSNKVLAEVRTCQHGASGYRVGVSIENREQPHS